MLEQRHESYEKFNYLLRPCKQVERRLLIEGLLRLVEAGYSIRDYAYLGFGSVYYADFILFHKYLYIDDMICVESSDIPKRMRFNKPFRFVKLRMKPFAEVIPGIRRSKRHLVWLDYDRPLDQSMLQDIAGTMHVLAPGSIFIITVDARARLPEDWPDYEMSDEQKEESLIALYREWFRHVTSGDIDARRLGRNERLKLFWEVLHNLIEESLSIRADMRFLQLFNYSYADGAPMLTVGGLVDSAENCRKVRQSSVFNLSFITDRRSPIKISVPPLTIREKQWLDSNLGKRMRFELPPELLANYRRYYREYPVYLEGLI